MANTFLGKCASITMMDLITKFGSCLVEQKLDLIFYHSIRIMIIVNSLLPREKKM